MRQILIKSTFALALGVAPGLAMAQNEMPRHNAPDQSQGGGGGQLGGSAQGGQSGGQMRERGGEMRGSHGMQRGGEQGGAAQGDQGGGQMQERGGEMRGSDGMQRRGQEDQQGQQGRQRSEERGGEMQGRHGMRPIGEGQRTEVRNIFREVHVEPERSINFSVNVGARVPREVHLHPLPARIVEIVPDYRDDAFFVLPDGRIVIVDAGSLEVVAIIG